MERYTNSPDKIQIEFEKKTDSNYIPMFIVYLDNIMNVWDEKGTLISYEIPNWLADGIRELVKNKIEQENNRGA